MSTPEEDQAREPMVWTVDHRPGAKEKEKKMGDPMQDSRNEIALNRLTGAVKKLTDALRQANEILAGAVAGQPDTEADTPQQIPVRECPDADNGYTHEPHVWRYFLQAAFCEGHRTGQEEAGSCPLLAEGRRHNGHVWSPRPGTHHECPGVMVPTDGTAVEDLPVESCPASVRTERHPGHAWTWVKTLPLRNVVSQCPGYPLPEIPDPVGCPAWDAGQEHDEHRYGPPGNTCPGA